MKDGVLNFRSHDYDEVSLISKIETENRKCRGIVITSERGK
jgi:hypothetical protein